MKADLQLAAVREFRSRFSRKRMGVRAWIEAFCQIKDAGGDIHPIVLNQPQRYVLSRVLRQLRKTGRVRMIVQKGRQIGQTTLFVCLDFENIVRGEHVASRLVSHTRESATEILQMLHLMVDKLKEEHEVDLVLSTDRDDALGFAAPIRGSIAISSAESKNPGRGGTKQFQHFSEVAFWGNKSYALMSALRILVHDKPDTYLFIESTPYGADGYFYDAWQLAVEGRSDLEPIFIPWFWFEEYRRPIDNAARREIAESLDDEERALLKLKYFRRGKGMCSVDFEQLAWRRWAIPNLCSGQLDKFHQEFPSTPEEGFTHSGRPVFDRKKVAAALAVVREQPLPVHRGEMKRVDFTELVAGAVDFDDFVRANRTPELIHDEHGPLTVWKTPVAGLNYCVGADVAEGTRGGDYSVAYVLELGTRQMVATWRGKMDPEAFGQMIWQLGVWYGDGHGQCALVGPEANNHGLSTCNELIRTLYPNLYMRVLPGQVASKPTKKVGWLTTVGNRKNLIDHARTDIGHGLTQIRDAELLREMAVFHFNEKGEMEPPEIGPDGRAGHDDCIMAFAITLQLWESAFQAGEVSYTPSKPLTEDEKHWLEVEEELYGDQPVEERI